MLKEDETLNEETETLPEDGQSELKPESTEDDTSKTEVDFETKVKTLEEKLAKAESDRDNYKTGMLTKEEELKKFKKSPELPVKNSNPVVDESYPEREGKAQFKLRYPGESIKELLPYYKNVYGNDTATGVLKNLEEAIAYRNFKNNIPVTEVKNSGQGAGVSEPEQGKIKKQLTQRQIELAKKFGNDPEKVY